MSAAHRTASGNRVRFRSALCSLAFIALALGFVSLAAAVRPASAQGPKLAVDARPEGNGPHQLGPRDPCVSVASGDTFDIDISIEDVDQLLAWEIHFEYNPTIVQIIDRDVRLFQGDNPGSAVFDVSESLPDSNDIYRVAAADTADPPSPDSGSGVLARLTLRAINPGISTASLANRDLNGDGKPDLSPFLRNADAEPIGDEDGDTFFDGPIEGAQIAVDQPCPDGSQTAAGAGRTTSDDGAIPTVFIAALALAAAAAVGTGATLFLYLRRTRASSISD